MGVEGVAGHEGTLKLVGGVFVEETLGDGQFAVVFFAAVGALGEGLAGGVETERDDAAEPAFSSDAFAVQGEGFGKEFAVCHQPRVEGAGEFNGIDAVDDVVKGAVAGHGEETGFRVAPGHADGAALVLIKRRAFVPDCFDVLGTADEAINDEGEHGAEGVADGFGVTGVGEVHKSVAQGA